MMLGFEKALYTCLYIVTLGYFWIHRVHALLSPLMFRFDEADHGIHAAKYPHEDNQSTDDHG